jgi:hypothetical protein
LFSFLCIRHISGDNEVDQSNGDIYLNLEEIVNSIAVTDFRRLSKLYIILGQIKSTDKKNKKNLFIVLVPVADPNEMKNSVFILQTSYYANATDKTRCNNHRKIAELVHKKGGMDLGYNGVTLFNTFIPKGSDLPTGNYTANYYDSKLRTSWSENWGRETAKIYKEPKKKHSAFSIIVPKFLHKYFSDGGTPVSAKLQSRSGLLHRKKDRIIVHSQLEKLGSDLPPRMRHPFDGNLRQESMVSQGKL